jgi:HAD superfamily hydrolase (TIGR01484 family)
VNHKIKMVAMDFDMTLVDHTAQGILLPTETKALLISLLDSGMDVGIVSGRYFWEMKDILERLQMNWANPFPSFYISREAFIFRLEDGEMKPDLEWNEKYRKETADFMKDLSGRASDILDLLAAMGLQIYNWNLFSDYAFEIHLTNEEDAELACDLVRNCLIQDNIIARVHRNRNVVNVLHPQTGKGNTLLRLAQTQNLRPEQILTIGDSLNDADMLDGHLGFRSGAVGNAAPIIKDIVNGNKGIVAHTRAGSGVAEIILKYKELGFI